MTEPNEQAMARVLRAFVTALDEHDWLWCYAGHAFDGEPSKADRRTIKLLRERGYLKLHRGGGMDEDGNLIGGSGYGPTRAGKTWLKEQDAQLEIPL